MLIAILTILFLGGSSGEMFGFVGDARDRVKQVMPKGEDRAAALDTLDDVKKRLRAHQKDTRKAMKELDAAFRNRATTDDELESIWGAHFERLNTLQRDVIDLRFELREHVDRATWEQVFPPDTEN